MAVRIQVLEGAGWPYVEEQRELDWLLGLHSFFKVARRKFERAAGFTLSSRQSDLFDHTGPATSFTGALIPNVLPHLKAEFNNQSALMIFAIFASSKPRVIGS